MCRKAGRRCPSHTDEQAIGERNEVRREQYASKVLRDKTASFLENHGVKFVRGDEVENAYFQGKEDFNPDLFEGIKDASSNELMVEVDPNHFWSKPESGGLWTAPGTVEDGKVKTAWTNWSRENRFQITDNPVTPLRVRNQAIIVTIDNEEDIEALCKAYPKGNGFSYEAMAQAGIDGVRLSDEGQRNSKKHAPGSKLHNFSNWDIDSTVWINKENLNSGKPVEQGVYPVQEEDHYSPWDDEDGEELESWDDLMAQLEESSKQEVPHNEEEAAATRLRMKLQG